MTFTIEQGFAKVFLRPNDNVRVSLVTSSLFKVVKYRVTDKAASDVLSPHPSSHHLINLAYFHGETLKSLLEITNS